MIICHLLCSLATLQLYVISVFQCYRFFFARDVVRSDFFGACSELESMSYGFLFIIVMACMSIESVSSLLSSLASL